MTTQPSDAGAVARFDLYARFPMDQERGKGGRADVRMEVDQKRARRPTFEERLRGVLSSALAFVLAIAWTSAVAAQDQPPRERKNSIYGELIGSGLGLSLNYERMLTQRLSARVGGGYYADDPPGLELQGAANFVIVGRRHQLTAAVGVIGFWTTGYTDQVVPAGTYVFGELGYRYRSKSGFLFKATLATFPDEWTSDYPLFVIPGVSFGWSF